MLRIISENSEIEGSISTNRISVHHAFNPRRIIYGKIAVNEQCIEKYQCLVGHLLPKNIIIITYLIIIRGLNFYVVYK